MLDTQKLGIFNQSYSVHKIRKVAFDQGQLTSLSTTQPKAFEGMLRAQQTGKSKGSVWVIG